MYTLREHLKTPADIAKTCKRVRQMGYEAIQVSAFGPIEPTELAKILHNEGLEVAATHVSIDMMRDAAKCVDYHKTLGCKYPAIGGYNPGEHTPELYTAFAREYTHIGDQLAKQGLSVGYHNHSRELSRLSDGKTILDTLIDNSGRSVWFEIDVYWITHGGGDPAAWINKVQGRIPCIHFKDMKVSIKQEQQMCEVGSGNLNWPNIIQACKQAGTQWYLIERDNGELDPFESLKISFDQLKAMGVN
jgi:sugar phosphate isomerase/epimerase